MVLARIFLRMKLEGFQKPMFLENSIKHTPSRVRRQKKNSLKKWMNPRALSLLATDGHGMGPSLCPADGNGLRLDVLGGPKLLLSDGRGVRTEAGRHRVRSWRVRLPP